MLTLALGSLTGRRGRGGRGVEEGVEKRKRGVGGGVAMIKHHKEKRYEFY